MESPIVPFDQIPFPRIVETSTADIIRDFFVPLLRCATRYDRGVGYFSSGWLRIAGQGMVDFASRGGRARWVTSPILDVHDWEAILTGDTARDDELLKAKLQQNVADLATSLEKDTLSALAWMIADEIITFKLACPRNKLAGGEFHDKFGVFVDEKGNHVSFNGSYNDSIQGTRNYESIKVFCSWESAFVRLVEADADRFEKLWSNLDPNVRVFDLPEAVREEVLKLRETERPYLRPPWIASSTRELQTPYRPAKPTVPGSIVLRDYQLKAIEAWFSKGNKGFLEMATGAGKTITALAASARLYNQEGKLAVIVAVPYQHLVDQWKDDSHPFGYRPILAYENREKWLDDLHHEIMEYNAAYRGFISVITTHTTFISKAFQETISRLNGSSLLIADEAHHLGAEQSRFQLPETIPFRLALSATPDRWFDDEGTAALHDYFGEVVFRFPLEEAIGVCLTPYYYHPHLVELTADEMVAYRQLSEQIAKLMGRKDESALERLKMLLIRRAELLNKAENKLPCLSELIDHDFDVKYTLFYCAPEQIDQVSRLLGLEKGLLIAQFTNRESAKQRRELLEGFESGRWQALVAMHCLDEGVDVPNTRKAYILASSGNPREFIQRRGRILRRSSGKEHAIIHDMITIPPLATDALVDMETLASERSIMRRELQRFREFANLALNKHQAIDVIWGIASKYNLMDF
jgi:superfamily II DNA or RNA helicase